MAKLAEGYVGTETVKDEVQELALAGEVRQLVKLVILIKDMLREEELELFEYTWPVKSFKDAKESLLQRDRSAL